MDPKGSASPRGLRPMVMIRYRYAAVAMILLSSVLHGVASHAQEADERQQLTESRDRLQARIETLEREQDFLLFQKQMYVSDSKYLLLDLSAGKGELKYRNRILKNFTFTPVPPSSRRPPPGALVMTAKRGMNGKRQALLFGSKLILQAGQKDGSGQGERGTPRLSLSRRAMAPLFYALDKGSLAYIVR